MFGWNWETFLSMTFVGVWMGIVNYLTTRVFIVHIEKSYKEYLEKLKVIAEKRDFSLVEESILRPKK